MSWFSRLPFPGLPKILKINNRPREKRTAFWRKKVHGRAGPDPGHDKKAVVPLTENGRGSTNKDKNHQQTTRYPIPGGLL